MRRTALVPAVLVAAALTLTGCSTTVSGSGTRAGGAPSATDFPSSSGGASPTDSPTDTSTDSPSSSPTGGDATDLVHQAVQAMETRPQGFTLEGKSVDSDGVFSLDVRMATDSGQGTITINDHACDLVNVSGTGYAKAPAAFWTEGLKVGADVAAQVDNKWVKLSGSASALTTFVDASSFLDLATSEDQFTLGSTTTKQGIDVQAVQGSDATLYVSTDEPHLLIEVDASDGPIAFGYPDDALSVSAPSGAIPYPG